MAKKNIKTVTDNHFLSVLALAVVVLIIAATALTVINSTTFAKSLTNLPSLSTLTSTARPDYCQKITASKTTLSSDQTFTVKVESNTPVNNFYLAFYNADNLNDPNDNRTAKRLKFRGQEFGLPFTSITPLKSHTFTVKYSDLYQPDQNWNKQYPKRVSFLGYFSKNNGLVSIPQPNCWGIINLTPPTPPSPFGQIKCTKKEVCQNKSIEYRPNPNNLLSGFTACVPLTGPVTAGQLFVYRLNFENQTNSVTPIYLEDTLPNGVIMAPTGVNTINKPSFCQTSVVNQQTVVKCAVPNVPAKYLGFVDIRVKVKVGFGDSTQTNSFFVKPNLMIGYQQTNTAPKPPQCSVSVKVHADPLD